MSTAVETLREKDLADLRKAVEPLRAEIRDLGDNVKALKAGDGAVQRYVGDTEARGEAIANVQLAYRHLEDARMRLGKVLQAADGGVSVYDKSPQLTEG